MFSWLNFPYCSIMSVQVQGGDHKEISRFAEPKTFVGFETNLDFSNQGAD